MAENPAELWRALVHQLAPICLRSSLTHGQVVSLRCSQLDRTWRTRAHQPRTEFPAMLLESLLASPIWFMRKRDLAIAAVLVLIALASFALFVRSWVRARARRREAPGPPGPPPSAPPPPSRLPSPPDEVSKTRGVR